jgi:hypothetical protein
VSKFFEITYTATKYSSSLGTYTGTDQQTVEGDLYKTSATNGAGLVCDISVSGRTPTVATFANVVSVREVPAPDVREVPLSSLDIGIAISALVFRAAQTAHTSKAAGELLERLKELLASPPVG